MTIGTTVIPNKLSASSVDDETIKLNATGKLAVKTTGIIDDSTLDLDVDDKLQLKDDGVTADKVGYKTLELISSETLTETATAIEFTSLDSDVDNQYQMILKVPKSTIGNILYLSVNGDTTAANYRSQRTRYQGSTVLTGMVSNSQIGQNYSTENWNSYGIASISVVNGFLLCQAFSQDGETTQPIRMELYAITKTAAITKITSLGMYSSATDGLPIGTILELYKVGA